MRCRRSERQEKTQGSWSSGRLMFISAVHYLVTNMQENSGKTRYMDVADKCVCKKGVDLGLGQTCNDN